MKKWNLIIHAAIFLGRLWHDFDFSDLAVFHQCPDEVKRCWLGTILKKFECSEHILESKRLAVYAPKSCNS